MQFLAQTLNSVKDTGLVIDVSALSSTLKEVSSLSTKFKACISKLEKAVNAGGEISDVKEKAVFYRDKVLANMNEMRDIADRLEFLVAADNWPFPTYSELLFGE
jgi:glutamine synthetase